jgi:hypothetical protein
MANWSKDPVTSIQTFDCSPADVVTLPFYGTKDLCRKSNYRFTIGSCPTEEDSEGNSSTVGTDINGLSYQDMQNLGHGAVMCAQRASVGDGVPVRFGYDKNAGEFIP